jgi:prepilin-type N-terminal cleavage/methylation domain-containing protein
MSDRKATAGFTLIELMITIVIVAIVITVGVPSFNDFIASQRERTAASDLASDMAFARAEAIKESRWVIIEPIGGAGTWKDGWRIWVDLDNSRTRTATEDRKTSTGVSSRGKVCALGALDPRIVFRPDGRAFSAASGLASALTPVTATDGIRISDDLGDGVATNDRIRLVYIGVSGRASVEVQDGGTACP